MLLILLISFLTAAPYLPYEDAGNIAAAVSAEDGEKAESTEESGDEKAVENINTSFWDNIISWYGLSSKECRSISKNDIDDEENDEEAKIKICQQVLLELGQEVLAKRADWLLAVSDRNLQSPK